MVVISGAAITAGSSLQRFASIGSEQPINCEIMTIHIIDRLTTVAICKSPDIIHIRTPFTIANITHITSEILNSVNMTFKKSFSLISSTDIPRIIIVELCEPQLPPVLISIGINDTSAGIAAHASSYFV